MPLQFLTFKKEWAGEEARQIYRPDSVHQASLAGNHSSGYGIADVL